MRAGRDKFRLGQERVGLGGDRVGRVFDGVGHLVGLEIVDGDCRGRLRDSLR